MRCPHCKNRVLQKSGKVTRVRSQGPVTFTQDGVCRARCYWCKGEIDLPIRLEDSAEVIEEMFILPAR